MQMVSALNLVRRGCVARCAAGLVVLAACGGGTSQIEPFVAAPDHPTGRRIRRLTADGKRYSINALTATNAINCSGLPIWTQHSRRASV